MDILKKAVLLVAILSISLFMAGGGEEAADEGGSSTEQTESTEGGTVSLQDLMEEAKEGEAEE